MKFLLSQIKNFFTNRISLSAVLANFVLAIWGLSEKDWSYNSFHFIYEPIPIKILTIINIPAIAIGESLANQLFPSPSQPFGYVETNNSEMLFIVIFSILQWLLFGFVCKLIFQEKLK
jgi:hypothetical protein